MIFRLRDYAGAPLAIWREHQLLDRAQWWTALERRDWAQERLERVLEHAVRHVPYYRETLGPRRSAFASAIHRMDLSELPVLTKEDVRQHYDALVSDDAGSRSVSTTETSGSTGTPTRFLLERSSHVHQFAAIWRVLSWTGYRFGQRYADLTGYLPSGGALAEFDWRTNCLHLSTFDFKKEHIAEHVRRLERFRPVLIKAYPSSIDLFCRWLRELGIEYRPRAVITCAESLLDHQRGTIADVLGCPVYDFYNQNERGALISTCGHGTYHVHEEYALTELVEAGDGLAHILATNYHNLAMPLIRYRTDDLAEPATDPPCAGTCDDGGRCTCGRACACGRTYRRVARIVGRVEDVVVTPDGRHVGRLDAAFKYSPGIRLAQVVQERPDEIEVRLVRSATFAPSDVERLESELRARLGSAIGIRYVYVDDIPVGRNGTLKFVVSSIGRAAVRAAGAEGQAARSSSRLQATAAPK